MAYISILDTQLDPDAPITSSLGYQFRDNPEAIALGLSGATRIRSSALALDKISGPFSVAANGITVGSVVEFAENTAVAAIWNDGATATPGDNGTSDLSLYSSPDSATWTMRIPLYMAGPNDPNVTVTRPIPSGVGITTAGARYWALRANGDGEHNYDATNSFHVALMGIS